MTKNLIAFIDKVQTIEISTINGCLDLSRYRYGVTEEEEELKRLQQSALTELLSCDSNTMHQHLGRLDQIKLRFEKIWDIWSDAATAFINGTLNEDDFIEQIKNNFLAPGLIPGRITQSFISDLQDAIMNKEAALIGFIDQLPGHQEHDHSFISHLTIPDEKRQPFADGLKKAYEGIQGAELGYLLRVMFEKDLLKPGSRAELYRGLREFFGWDIGEPSGINRVLAMKSVQSSKINPYREKIQNIYNSIE